MTSHGPSLTRPGRGMAVRGLRDEKKESGMSAMTETASEINTAVTHDWMMTDTEFFQRIDSCGGWPLGMRFISIFHDGPGKGRRCAFGNQRLRTDWWTTICEADDYYWWKLSPDGKQKYIERSVKATAVLTIKPTVYKLDDVRYRT